MHKPAKKYYLITIAASSDQGFFSMNNIVNLLLFWFAFAMTQSPLLAAEDK